MPLYFKDRETAELVAELAAAAGMIKTAVVREAPEAHRTQLPQPEQPKSAQLKRWRAYRQANPLPAATERKADKALFDEMWGEQD